MQTWTRARANALLIVVALVWGSAFVAQSWGMSSIGPMLFTGLRFLLGALVVAPLAWLEMRALHAKGQVFGRRGALQIAGLGLLLFVITFIVLACAQLMLRRMEKGKGKVT